MKFHEVTLHDEDYWFVKDGDGELTVVMINIVKNDGETHYLAGYQGSEEFYDATDLDYVGIAVPMEPQMYKALRGMSAEMTNKDFLSGRHFHFNLETLMNKAVDKEIPFNLPKTEAVSTDTVTTVPSNVTNTSETQALKEPLSHHQV